MNSAPNANQRPHDLATGRCCLRCGYSLRALTPDDACPECGTPVVQSLGRDLLRLAEPGWLARVDRGLRMAQFSRWALAGLMVLFMLLLLSAIVLVPRGVDTLIETYLDSAIMGLISLLPVPPIVMAIGYWMAFEPEPRELADAGARHALRRGAAVMSVPAFGLWFGLSALRSHVLTALDYLLLAVLFLTIVASLLVLLDCARRLIERTEAVDPERLDALRGHRRTMLILSGLLFFGCIIGPFRWMEQGTWTAPPRDTLSSAFSVLALIWLVHTGDLSTARRYVHDERVVGAGTVVDGVASSCGASRS